MGFYTFFVSLYRNSISVWLDIASLFCCLYSLEINLTSYSSLLNPFLKTKLFGLQFFNFEFFQFCDLYFCIIILNSFVFCKLKTTKIKYLCFVGNLNGWKHTCQFFFHFVCLLQNPLTLTCTQFSRTRLPART